MNENVAALLDRLTSDTDQLLDRACFLADAASGILAGANEIKGISEEDSGHLDTAYWALAELEDVLDRLRKRVRG
jgi:hypothetical protein